MEHKAFIIYKSHCKIISKLSNEKKGILLQKIIDYHETGEIYETDIQVDMAFEFMQVNFDIDRERYEKKCEVLSENGKKGGLAKASKGKQKLANAKNQSGKLANHSNEVEKEVEDVNENGIEIEKEYKRKEALSIDTEQTPTYGKEELNLMQGFLRQAVGVTQFKDSKERWYVQHCYNLMKKIGKEEFQYRLKEILSDPFKQKNSNKLAYLYGELKSYIHSPVVEPTKKERFITSV